MNTMQTFPVGRSIISTAVLVGAAIGANPRTASAHGFGVSFALRGTPVWVPPVYETRERIIVEAAVIQERPARKWCEPVYEDRRVRVEVPAEVRTRRVPVYNSAGRIVAYKLVEEIISPARTVWKTERVLVKPGLFETVIERVVVKPENRRIVHDQVLVSAGRWEYPTYWFRGGRPRREVHIIDRPAPPEVGVHIEVHKSKD